MLLLGIAWLYENNLPKNSVGLNLENLDSRLPINDCDNVIF